MKKRYIYVILIFLIFNVLLIVKPANNIIQNTIFNIQNFFSSTTQSITGSFDNFATKKELEEENEKLQTQVEDLNKQLKEQQSKTTVLEEKNSDLSSTLEVKPYEDNEHIMANVINKKSGTNLNVLTIDKGKNDGLVNNQIVSYNGKIIGYISNVEKSKSEVILLNNSNIKFNIPVSIYTNKGKVNATIQSYDVKQNKLIIKPLTKNKNITITNKVYTNGYSQSQAQNVYVGEIDSEVEINSSDKSYTIPLTIDTYDYVEVVL